MALPLVLHILDVKLSTNQYNAARKQGRLKIYTEAMKGFKLQYDGTDEVSDFIRRMIDYISIERPVQRPPLVKGSLNSFHKSHDSSCRRSSSSAPIWSATVVNDWSDVLLRQPNLYVRILLTIDISLSKGYFPDESDFPTALQSQHVFDNCPPLHHLPLGGTSREISDIRHGIRQPDSEMDKSNRREHHNNNSPLPNGRISMAEQLVDNLTPAGNFGLPMYGENLGMAIQVEDTRTFYSPALLSERDFSEVERFLSLEEQAFLLINQG